MVGIIAVAKNISIEIVDRFINSINKSLPSYEYAIHIAGKDDTNDKFYKTRILNAAIRKLVNDCDVIIQSDIDLLIPPKLIDYTYNKSQSGVMIHSSLRHIKLDDINNLKYEDYPWDKWLQQKPVFCSGCWNGMSSTNWIKSKGYNELMFEWGAEDTEFYKRCSRYGIKYEVTNDFPLVHVHHDQRTSKRPKENMELSNKYPDWDWLADGLPLDEK